jgi:hypothetical protein
MNKPDKNSPFSIFKPFDITTMGYYAYIDFQNVEYLKTKFDSWKVESNYLWHTKTSFSNPIVRWYDHPDGRICGISDYQNNYSWVNKGDPRYYSFWTQSDSRDVYVRDYIVYLDFPIWYFSKDVKNTTFGKFDYDVLVGFFDTMNKNGWTGKNFQLLCEEYNKKYPQIENEEYVWNSNAHIELYGSFKKYGRLTLTVIDRPRTLFVGSSHNLFHASVLGWETLPFFVTIPYGGRYNKRHRILSESWYCYIQPNNFSHNRYDESEIFYMFYIDIKHEKIYGKKYNVSEFEYFKNNIQHLPKRLYEEFDLITG